MTDCCDCDYMGRILGEQPKALRDSTPGIQRGNVTVAVHFGDGIGTESDTTEQLNWTERNRNMEKLPQVNLSLSLFPSLPPYTCDIETLSDSNQNMRSSGVTPILIKEIISFEVLVEISENYFSIC